MYIIHAPTHPTVDARIKSNLELAHRERQVLKRLLGEQTPVVIDVVETTRVSDDEIKHYDAHNTLVQRNRRSSIEEGVMLQFIEKIDQVY